MFKSFKLLVLKSMARITETLLRQKLLSAIRSVSGDFFTFQQDSAQPIRSRKTVALLSAETPDFISPMDWPLG